MRMVSPDGGQEHFPAIRLLRLQGLPHFVFWRQIRMVANASAGKYNDAGGCGAPCRRSRVHVNQIGSLMVFSSPAKM